MAATKAKPTQVLKVTRAEAVELFKAVKYPSADTWPDAKLVTKLKKLNTMIDPPDVKQVKDKELRKTVEMVLAAIESDTDIVLDAAPAKDGKAKPAAPVAAKGGKGKKPTPPPEDDEEDEDEDEDEEDADDTDDEEDESDDDDEEDSEDDDSDEEDSDEEDDESEDEDDEDEVSDDEDDEDSDDADDEDEDEDGEEDEDTDDESDDDEDASEDEEDEPEDDDESEDEDESDDEDEDDDVDEEATATKPAKKTGKGGKPAAKPAKTGKADKTEKKGPGTGPGILKAAVEMLANASSTKPLSKKALVAKLVKKFPDRKEASLLSYVNTQIPNRLLAERGLEVKKNENGYWIDPKKHKKVLDQMGVTVKG